MNKKKVLALVGAGVAVILISVIVIVAVLMKGCAGAKNLGALDNTGTVENMTNADGSPAENKTNPDGSASDDKTTNQGQQEGGNQSNGNGGSGSNGENGGSGNAGNSTGSGANGSSGTGGNINSGNGGQSDNSSQVTVAVRFNISNSWESGGKKFVQYDMTVNNNSGTDVKSWQVKIPINNGLMVSQKWNCITSVEGSYIVINPESYNKTIAKGGSITGIGLIMSADKAHNLSDYIVKADGKESYGDNIVADGSGSSSSGSSSSGGSSSGGSSSGGTDYTPATPPEAYGGLHVSGTNLVDATGSKIQLKGPSTHGLQWFPDYINKDAFKTFRDDWGANVIRLAMYAREGGYVGGDAARFDKLIDDGVRYATELGMYVIIDWHVLSYNPNETKSEAVSFFEKMSKKYADNNNVIYEICNEPTNSEWNSQIKPYAETVISAIRKYDNDALIIVGTNTWSQDVDAVVGNKINDHNVMYALHFYAGTHKDNIRNKLKTAIAGGVPVFVSECSITDASGNGAIDYDSANTWLKLMNEYNISYIAWSMCNKNETSALLAPGNSKKSGWTVNDLSEAGKWWRKVMRGEIK